MPLRAVLSGAARFQTRGGKGRFRGESDMAIHKLQPPMFRAVDAGSRAHSWLACLGLCGPW
jgi:hypothetical protein